MQQKNNQQLYQEKKLSNKTSHGHLYRWTENSFPFFFISETSRDIKKNVLTSFMYEIEIL